MKDFLAALKLSYDENKLSKKEYNKIKTWVIKCNNTLDIDYLMEVTYMYNDDIIVKKDFYLVLHNYRYNRASITLSTISILFFIYAIIYIAIDNLQ